MSEKSKPYLMRIVEDEEDGVITAYLDTVTEAKFEEDINELISFYRDLSPG